ncbi:MAG: hypothetical protein LBU04_05825 [Christensenellaceae bacterium]|jgi:hypothetical protein|nr:hypothetical protein [Christensenellaceae bacterium]
MEIGYAKSEIRVYKSFLTQESVTEVLNYLATNNENARKLMISKIKNDKILGVDAGTKKYLSFEINVIPHWNVDELIVILKDTIMDKISEYNDSILNSTKENN